MFKEFTVDYHVILSPLLLLNLNYLIPEAIIVIIIIKGYIYANFFTHIEGRGVWLKRIVSEYLFYFGFHLELTYTHFILLHLSSFFLSTLFPHSCIAFHLLFNLRIFIINTSSNIWVFFSKRITVLFTVLVAFIFTF